MSLTQIPSYTTLEDQQFITVVGPDGITTGYAYDAQQRALYFKESQILSNGFHGATHIAEDPVPSATCDSPGLMAADDKCKLDALLQTRIGVLGFQGAGFPSDGGWMQGDIILASGSEFISLERLGNVVRFTVDIATPYFCNCETCTQIYWVQDETDTSSIRPPTCNGKLPGSNVYGEMKVYLFPESTVADPANAAATLNNKGNYPSFIFKRYDDEISPSSGELELVLKRDSNNQTTTEIGWAFTPGATGTVECVWFTGKDGDGNITDFKIVPESEPGLLGTLLYKGHLLTKRMAVITDYTTSIISTNQYTVKDWDVDGHEAVGDSYTATNVWQYNNPENPASGNNAQALIMDVTIDLIPKGTLVDIWSFKVGEVSGEPILRRYFSQRPSFNPAHAWVLLDQIQFGDVAVAREEVQPSEGSEDKDSAAQVSAIRDIELARWGITNYDDPVLSFDTFDTDGTEAADLTVQHRAVIDTSLPGLKVVGDSETTGNYSERPVWVWNRTNVKNTYCSFDIGRPSSSSYTPFDILFRTKIDSHDNRYMHVVAKGTSNGMFYITVDGVHFHDLPQFGAVRVISPSGNKNIIFNYTRKFINLGDDTVILAGDSEYLGDADDVVELLHQEYGGLCVRCEFGFDSDTELISLQFKVGNLDMSLPYEDDDEDNDVDDFVRGLEGGYAVSAVYQQAGVFTGVGTQPTGSPDTFVVYDGGAQTGGSDAEYWNKLEIMLRDDQLWIWWNRLLIVPSTSLSAALSTPVTVTTPYFPVTESETEPFGKVGMRLWPGATLRRAKVTGQLELFNEFAYGQLIVS